MNVGPYSTGGNPNHPGVKGGQPYNSGPIGGMTKVDVPGTGTFTPDQQGTVNKAQPAGLSSSNQYGIPSAQDPNQNQGFRVMGTLEGANVPGPTTHPAPMGDVGMVQQPQVPGVNVALDADAASIEENTDGSNENQSFKSETPTGLSDTGSEDAESDSDSESA